MENYHLQSYEKNSLKYKYPTTQRKRLSTLRQPFFLFLKDVSVVRKIAISLPSVKLVGGSEVGLKNEHSQNANHKQSSRDDSPLIESSVGMRRLILAVEGISSAGNSTGETVLTTLLKKNRNYDKRCGQKQKHKKYVFKNLHRKNPF